jgi:hypothetical protein
VSLDETIENQWLEWMKEEHIPEVMSTGLFLDKKIFRLLSHEQDGAISYAIQYFAESVELIQIYQEKHAAVLQEKHDVKFKDRFVAFRTMLEEVV